MSQFVDEPTVTRRIGECQCPGAPHADGDTVTLDAVLDLQTGLAAVRAMRDAANRATKEGRDVTANELGEVTAPVYFAAVRGWNFVADNGEGVPFTPANLARVKWPLRYRIAELADELYGSDLLTPLLETTPSSSLNGQTASSTSVNRQSRRHPPRPSGPSSATSTAGAQSVAVP